MPIVFHCPVCGEKVNDSFTSEQLPIKGQDHPLFGDDGHRFILCQEGAHLHFVKHIGARHETPVKCYAYIKSKAYPPEEETAVQASLKPQESAWQKQRKSGIRMGGFKLQQTGKQRQTLDEMRAKAQREALQEKVNKWNRK